MRGFIIATVAVTVLVCAVFMLLNPVLFSQSISDFSQDEVFYPSGGTYDLRLFNISATNSSNFTVVRVDSGFAQMMAGDTYAITVLDYDKIFDFEARRFRYDIEGEMMLPSETVDGIRVYKADFIHYQRYGSFVNHGNLELFVTSGDANETAHMVKSLRFADSSAD